jgi:hypothetical protein
MIRRSKGEFVAECNDCEAEEFGGVTEDFREFVAEIQAEGWSVKKDGEEWQHFCPDCTRDRS